MDASDLREWGASRAGRYTVAAIVVLALLLVWALTTRRAGPIPVAVVALSRPPASAVPPAPLVSASDSGDALPAEPGEVQVCGGAWLKEEPDETANEAELDAYNERAGEVSRSMTLAAMQASGDPRARGAAYFLQSRWAASAAIAASAAASTVSFSDLFRDGPNPNRDALVDLAQTSTDPQVYAWALQACHFAAPDTAGPCQVLNAEQWARLDPANAAPWLILAGEAARREDAGGLDDAMFHVASAQRLDTGRGWLVAEVLRFAPTDDSHVLGTASVVMDAGGFDAATTVEYRSATQYCRAETLIDSNHRQTCEGVADLFVERSTDLLQLGIGLGMARRLGWPQEKIQAIDDERAAMMASIPGPVMMDARSSCRELRRQVGLLGDRLGGDRARYGELGALRRAVAASGKTVPQLAAEFRASTAALAEASRRERAVASAASAAPANAVRTR